MRILYHHRTLADGAEGVHIEEMVEAFRSLGHEVVVEALARPNARGQGGGVLASVKALLPKRLFELSALAYNAIDRITVGRAIRRNRPDLLYKRHALFDLGALVAARRAGVPVILEVNSAYSSPVYQGLEDIRFKGLATRCERQCVKGATLVVAVSTPLRDLLAALVPGKADHIIVEPNGANPRRFSSQPAGTDDIRRQLGDGTQLIVGWCGILRDWHGLDLLFRAMRRVEGPRLAIIGDGPDRQRVERVAREQGIAGRTVFTGRVPHAAMPAYIAALDIAVAAGDRTGYASPMKVLEYMAAGRAVVAPELPGLRDIINDGVDGLLFAAGDEEALVAAITRLARDSQLRRQLGQRARLKIERERNWQRIAGSVLATLEARQAGRAMGTRERGSVCWREPERTGIVRDRSR